MWLLTSMERLYLGVCREGYLLDVSKSGILMHTFLKIDGNL